MKGKLWTVPYNLLPGLASSELVKNQVGQPHVGLPDSEQVVGHITIAYTLLGCSVWTITDHYI